MVRRASTTLLLLVVSFLVTQFSSAFTVQQSSSSSIQRSRDVTVYAAETNRMGRRAFGSAVLVSSLSILPAFADELGVETEAPIQFTGESVMICKRRGPLGACLETETRTEENDNDKAKKYFRDPGDLLKQKMESENLARDQDANELIRKLRQQSEDNREKNELVVQQRTFENDQAANFGPFDRQVVIMNTDGRTYTLLENPQAMRLKDAGFIEGRRFIKQPTPEEIDEALIAPDNVFTSLVKGIFGGGEEEEE